MCHTELGQHLRRRSGRAVAHSGTAPTQEARAQQAHALGTSQDNTMDITLEHGRSGGPGRIAAGIFQRHDTSGHQAVLGPRNAIPHPSTCVTKSFPTQTLLAHALLTQGCLVHCLLLHFKGLLNHGILITNAHWFALHCTSLRVVFTSQMFVLVGHMLALYLHCGCRYLGVLVVDLQMLLHLWYL